MRISVIIPALNEAETIEQLLSDLGPLRSEGHEVIVADGGSTDATISRASPLADRIVSSSRGRARQMNAGAREATGDLFWFLHADSHPPDDATHSILHALQDGRHWGRFDIRLSGGQPLLRIVEGLMNLRSCLSGIATGDQGIFVTRDLFLAAGGFPDIPLMEDIALSKALRRHAARPACLRTKLVTSSRRWEENGIWRTILLMWRLRLAYALGADPARLVKRYYP